MSATNNIFEKAIEFMLRYEGGLNQNIQDRGGTH